ncbi:MAG: hypothetical protein AAF367_06330 [Pseudomonadota bacterium]
MKLALWQMQPRSGIDAALDALAHGARTAASEGADLLVTPEMHLGGYNIGAEGQFAYNGPFCVTRPDGTDLARGADICETLLAILDRGALNNAGEAQPHLTDHRADFCGGLP